MFGYRVRSKFNAYDLYLPPNHNGTIILFVPGLPGHPRKKDFAEKLVDRGYGFLEMRFWGSWESDGVFTIDNCLKSFLEAYNFAKKGKAKELRFGNKVVWRCRKVVVVATSFGGVVALSAPIKESYRMLLLAPLTHPRESKKSLRSVNGSDDLFYLLTKGYRNAYRGLNKVDWSNFLSGASRLDPEKNIKYLRNKEIIIFHGTQDKVISPEESRRFIAWARTQGVKGIKYRLVRKAGHGSDLEKKGLKQIFSALKK